MTWSIIFHEKAAGRIGTAVGARLPNIAPQMAGIEKRLAAERG